VDYELRLRIAARYSTCPGPLITAGGDLLYPSPSPSTVAVEQIVNIEAVEPCGGGETGGFTTLTSLSTLR
jgi:hypothetical protein